MRCTIIHTMPTLQQLNIVDTETQEKLSIGSAGVKRKQHQSSSTAAANTSNINESPHNRALIGPFSFLTFGNSVTLIFNYLEVICIVLFVQRTTLK